MSPLNPQKVYLGLFGLGLWTPYVSFKTDCIQRKSFWNHNIKKWSDITSPLIVNDNIIGFIAFLEVQKMVTKKTQKI